ncbi:hypothetical protein ACFLV7_00905 [Chloroflexota bacterium]
MSWEDRDGRRYYYRKHRVGRCVVSEYIGSGLMAELVSEQDEKDRQQRIRDRKSFENLIVDTKKMDDELDSLIDVTCACVRASLLISGFHPHKGQWRKKRND